MWNIPRLGLGCLQNDDNVMLTILDYHWFELSLLLEDKASHFHFQWTQVSKFTKVCFFENMVISG